MKKHHEKVILKSDLFKARKTPEKTPEKGRKSASKSPMAKSSYATPLRQELKVDPNELFQKVCCPNCKYVFKIIKQSDILIQQPSKLKSMDVPIHKAIQTDEIMKDTIQLNNLSQQLNRQLTNRNDSFLFRTDSFRNNTIPINQAHESSRIRSNTYRFEELPLSKKQNSKRVSFEAKSQSSSALPTKFKQKHGRSSQQRESEIKKSIVSRDSIAKPLERKQSQIGTLVIHKIENDSVLDELCQFYRQLPQSFQIPAYRKMLVQQFATLPINPLSS